MVQHVVGIGCMDVHRLHIELVRDLAGPICRRHEAHNVPQHHVSSPCQATHRRPLGALIRYLLPTAGRLEGYAGNQALDYRTSPCNCSLIALDNDKQALLRSLQSNLPCRFNVQFQS